MMNRLLATTLCFLLVFPGLLHAQGAVKGRVIFEGTPPPIEKVEVKSDVATCGSHKEVSKITFGADKGVADAVVRIIGASGALEPKKGTLDQIQCQFAPHVQALPAGSTLVITSSDPVLHNAHGFYEDGSTAFNIAVPIMGMEVNQKLTKPGIIKLRCDAGHTWMSGYVVVTDSPYYALTDAGGNFIIEGVPPGDYEIGIWHEWLGERRQPVSVKEGQTEQIDVKITG
ncbi:MAG: carboxypeptidase regulatory-like domain-containing protein [Candidatus Omnitrophota bacterium]